jgi:hypothetical protein
MTHYTPGYRGPKLAVVAFGLILFLYGLSELWTPLFLLIKGVPTTAEVTRVVKTKAGLPDQIFVDDLHVRAAEEKRDRSYLFWNEFLFHSANGMEHVVRLSIGSQLKPLYPLLDEDGLPTTVQIYYDPQNPSTICIPTVLSTWFAPGMIAFMGLVGMLFGLTLLHGAGRRIEIH